MCSIMRSFSSLFNTGQFFSSSRLLCESQVARSSASPLCSKLMYIWRNCSLKAILLQVSKSLAKFSKIQITLATGGLDLKTQEDAVRRFPDVLIATPGRLIDILVNTPSFHLQNIEILG